MNRAARVFFAAAVAAAGLAGQSGGLQLISPLGREFHALPDDKGAVAEAQKALAADPKNVKLILKLAQAEASVWEEKEAVDVCTRGLAIAPDDADLLIERGHRELPLREFDRARDDLERAVTLDPKQTEAYYHLGLARYFLGDFAPAAAAFCNGRDLVTDQDGLVNFTNWCYVALRRAGRNAEAARALAKVPPEMQSNAGHTQFYFDLVRFYQGLKTEAGILPPAPKDPGDVEAELSFDTIAYQIGNWHLYSGNTAKAREYFERVAKGRVWITWGFVGAETDLARLRK